MKKLMIFLSLVITTSIFGQVDVIMIGFNTPKIPTDTNFSPINGEIKTKNSFYSKGNDINRDGVFLDDNEILLFEGKLNSEFNFVVDNQSNPTELTIVNSNLKVKLTGRNTNDNDSYFLPFLTPNVDSVVMYDTEYDFQVEFEYIGKSIETVHVYFDMKYNKKNLKVSKNWFNSLSVDEKLKLGNNLNDTQILNLWIEKIFLGSLSNQNFTENQKFTFKYTNYLHYTNDVNLDIW
jgi:hypothetical protein